MYFLYDVYPFVCSFRNRPTRAATVFLVINSSHTCFAYIIIISRLSHSTRTRGRGLGEGVSPNIHGIYYERRVQNPCSAVFPADYTVVQISLFWKLINDRDGVGAPCQLQQTRDRKFSRPCYYYYIFFIIISSPQKLEKRIIHLSVTVDRIRTEFGTG